METRGGREAQVPIIGLDFGTTNSCVSYLDPFGEPRSVSVATSNTPYDRVLPSVVLNPLADGDAGERRLVGQAAREEYGVQRDGLYLEYFKHRLDEQRLKQRVQRVYQVPTGGYDPVAQGPEMKTVTEWVDVGGPFSRKELVGGIAAVLQHLLQAAVADGADPAADLLVGIPVNYSGYARKRLVCGLNEVRLEDGRKFFDGFGDVIRRTRFVLEPVAVAAAPGEDLEVEGTENVLIFDHGGGTLDLSIVRYEQRDGFDRPVPVQELAAGGSTEVAGRHLDEAFLQRLREEEQYARAFEDSVLSGSLMREVIEEAKVALSTNEVTQIRFAGIDVGRELLEAAIAPKLDLIRLALANAIRRARLQIEDVNWVVMTGGSSLVPAVQRSVQEVFPDLAGQDRVLRYFPDDQAGVESAITDVAEGLTRFGGQRELRQIVLWDVELGREEAGGFIRLFNQGDPYELKSGRYEIEVDVEAPDIGRPGCSFAIYEHQLDRQFSFGLADVPRLEPDSRLRVKLRRDSLFPVMSVVDRKGQVVEREDSPTGWAQDKYAAADIETYEEGALADFFDEDAEYVPLVKGESFVHAPLVRKLRVGDFVEWSAMMTKEGLKAKQGAGEILQIRRIGHDQVLEMPTWNVAEYEFCAQTSKGKFKFETRNGCLRLAPRPSAARDRRK